MPSLDFCPFLKVSNSPVLSKFLHDCVDDLVPEKNLQFNNNTSDIEWTPEDYQLAKRSIQSFYKECVISESFELNVAELSENVKEAIKDCYEIRKQDILQALLEEHILDNGHNLVENFDWKLKWVLGSSKLASVRDALLQVDLHCVAKQEDDKWSRNIVNFEIDLKTVDNLITELEKGSALLQQKI